jgi:serine/threonine protein kinase
MSGTRDQRPADFTQEPQERHSWEKKVSQNLGEAADAAARLSEEWNRRFSVEAAQNRRFMKAQGEAAAARGGIPLFELVHRRSRYWAEFGTTPFQELYEHSLRSMDAPAAHAGPCVPVGLFYYLNEALEQAREQKDSGETFPDIEPADRLVALGNELLDDALLSGFRCDLLEGFSSRLETPPPSTKRMTSGPEPKLRIELESFIGKVFRGYTIERALGRGGFGAVFLAQHPTLPVQRALKIFLDIDRSGPGFDQFREKCLAEARLQATLSHENIVEIVDVFEDQGYVVLVMEYVQGKNLGHLIAQTNRAGRNLAPKEILELVLPIARGIAHAHEHGIVHRDIKPENILLEEKSGGRPKIADFGLARHLEESGQRQKTIGRLVGTPLYMAPEQIGRRATTYDHRCDLYSFGIVLYELALGTPPFAHEDLYKILEMHEKEKPKPLSLSIEGFPQELDRIILTCLEKRPEHRFAGADELVLALEQCRKDLALGITDGGRRPEDLRKSNIRSAITLIIEAVLVVGLISVSAYPLLAGWFGLPIPNPKLYDQWIAKRQGGASSLLAGQKELAVASVPLSSPAPVKAEPAPPEAKPAPPPPSRPAARLREVLAGYPVSPEALGISGQILDLVRAHRGELRLLNYDPTLKALGALEPAVKEEYSVRQLSAAREIVRLSDDLVKGRWKELKDSKDVLRLKLANGTTAQGLVERALERSLILRDAQGGMAEVELKDIASEEFLQGKTFAAAELAYQALSGDAGIALQGAFELEKTRESIAFWYPLLVRMLRSQISEHLRASLPRAEAGLTRKEAKGDLEKALPSWERALVARRTLAEAREELCSLFPWLSRDFTEADRECEAMEALLGGSYSRVLTSYAGTEAAPHAATLLLAGFALELGTAHDELLEGSGWFNWRWELRPTHPDVKVRGKYLVAKPEEALLVLQDEEGPRSLVMNEITSRAPEGVLLRVRLEAFENRSEAAEWRFHLLSEKSGTSYLRVTGEHLEVYRSTLSPGAADVSLARVPLLTLPTQEDFRTFALVPGPDHLHVFVDRQLLLSIPCEDAMIPKQLSLVVFHGKLSVRNLQAKRAPAPDGGNRK